MIRIIEGQSRKYIQGGQYNSASTCPLELLLKGGFVAPTVDVQEYGDVDPTASPVVYLNVVEGNREDVQEAGLAIIGGTPYTLETDICEDAVITAGIAGSPLSVSAPSATVPSILKLAAATDLIYGYLKSKTGTTVGTDTVIASMLVSNDGLNV